MASLRTKKSDDYYKRLIAKGHLENGCNLCKEKKEVKKFKHWRILKAKFPWDRIAKIHHLIIPVRHTTEEKLTKVELKEFHLIKKNYIHGRYELIAEATKKKKTIPSHFHLHIIAVKPA